MVSAQIEIPGIANGPTVLVAHIPGPWPQPIDGWDNELERMNGTMQSLSRSAGNGCALVAGDFNSTLEMAPFRRLLGNGFRDAAEQAGAGFTLTYPANTMLPAFMGIDHILTSKCVATSVRTVTLPGSDHRGLATTVDVPS
jgi:endonuclease/exonuclease/phosphatase (EEP) superfamily protein YafD